MRNWRAPVAALMLAVTSFVAHAADEDVQVKKSQGPVTLLPPAAGPAGEQQTAGTLHLPGREYSSGNGWWALTCRGTCELKPLRLNVSARKHPQYDGEPVPGQWLQFSPTPPAGTLILFKPVRAPADGIALQAGPVQSWHPGLTSRLRRPAQTAGTMEGELMLPGGKALRLVPTLLLPKNPPAKNDDASPTLVLDLVMDGKRQTLGAFEFGIEGMQAMKPDDYVSWIGDMDRDGKPDLLVNLSFSGFGSRMVLFLSSLATEGELVGEAGSFIYFMIDVAGC